MPRPQWITLQGRESEESRGWRRGGEGRGGEGRGGEGRKKGMSSTVVEDTDMHVSENEVMDKPSTAETMLHSVKFTLMEERE